MVNEVALVSCAIGATGTAVIADQLRLHGSRALAALMPGHARHAVTPALRARRQGDLRRAFGAVPARGALERAA